MQANIKLSSLSQKPGEPLFTSWDEIDSDHIDDDGPDFDLSRAIEESWKEQEDQENEDFQKALQESRLVEKDIGLQSEGAGPSSASKFDDRFPPFTEKEEYEEIDDDGDLQNAIAASVAEFKPKPLYLEQKKPIVIPMQSNITSTDTIIKSPPFSAVINPKPELQTPLDEATDASKAPPAATSININTSRFFSVSPSPPNSPNRLVQSKSVGATSQTPQKYAVAAGSHFKHPARIPSPTPDPVLSASAHRPFQDIEEEEKLTSIDFGLPEEELSFKPDSPLQTRPAGQVLMEVDEEEDDDDMIEEDLGFGLDDDLPEEVSAAILAGRSPNLAPKAEAEDSDPMHDLSRHQGALVNEDVGPYTATLDIVIDDNQGEDGHDITMDPDQPHDPEEEDWDAANEMDVQEEENEFAQFVAEVKGKDLDAVRDEIDEEIAQLHKEKKVHQRDSDEITHQMVGQIMVCHNSSSDTAKGIL